MWIENPIFRQDLDDICSDPAIPWAELDGKTILVTGGTGLIGSTLISAILYYGMKTNNPPRVIALVRDAQRAATIFKSQLCDCPNLLSFVVGQVQEPCNIEDSVDYIIHSASPTSSMHFLQHPVDTIQTAILGTMNMLEIAKEKSVSGFIYLSSMEVYGLPEKGHRITEEYIGSLSPLKPRNSYPLGKQLCENLCCAYAVEYGVPTKIARLTQTFGPGVSYNDGRVFAEFARCAIEKRDIVLKTTGETQRNYLYTADSVRAILTILLKGETANAYNVANEESFCSIAEMAQTVAQLGGIKVQFQLQDAEKLGYAPTLHMDLDTSKLCALGWKATTSLEDMYRRMIQTM